MAKYLLIYHGGGMGQTEAERNALMARWGAWFQEAGSAITDPGNPVSQVRTIQSDGSVGSDGGGQHASGYSIIEADGMDAAVAIARGCPVLSAGGTIEVAETFNAM